jgi:hypothetical protein
MSCRYGIDASSTMVPSEASRTRYDFGLFGTRDECSVVNSTIYRHVGNAQKKLFVEASRLSRTRITFFEVRYSPPTEKPSESVSRRHGATY